RRLLLSCFCFFFFFSSRRRHTRWPRDWSSDVCSSDLRRARRRALTVPDPSTLADARGVVARFGLTVPAVVTRALADPTNESPKRSEERRVGKECKSGGGPEH